MVPDLWIATEPRSGLRNARGHREQGSGAGGPRVYLKITYDYTQKFLPSRQRKSINLAPLSY